MSNTENIRRRFSDAEAENGPGAGVLLTEEDMPVIKSLAQRGFVQVGAHPAGMAAFLTDEGRKAMKSRV